jgi:hypothetical protein
VSVKAAPVKATAFVLDSVIVKTLVPPAAIVFGAAKDLAIVGRLSTVFVSVAEHAVALGFVPVVA